MDIVDLQEMGLIDGSTEYIANVADTPHIVYTQDGPINIHPDLAAYGNSIAYVTIPNIVHIVHDGNTQNVGYLINNDQIPFVNGSIVVNQDNFVELNEPISEENPDHDPLSEENPVHETISEDNPIHQLEKQLSRYLGAPEITVSHPIEETTPSNLVEQQLSPSRDVKSGKNAPSSSQEPNTGPDLDPSENEESLFCGTCNLNFPSWKLFKRHKLKHMNDKPFKCSKCNETFNYELNLNLHFATHNIDNPFCPVCKKKFGRIAGLKAHIMLHEQEESLFCNECGEEFNNHVYLQKHMKEHQSGSFQKYKSVKKVFACTYCKQNFSTSTARKEHLVKMHKISENRKLKKVKRRKRNNYNCDYCLKCFEKPSQLLRHKRVHTGERPYECQLCTRAFTQKGSLQIHMLKHTKEKPYICEYCQGTFSQKGNLQAHIKRLHMASDSDVRNYKCHLCSCVFRKLGSLNAHFTKAHSVFNTVLVKPSGSDKCEKFNCDPKKKIDSSSDSSNKENEITKKIEERPGIVTITNLTIDGTIEQHTDYQRKLNSLCCKYCSKEFKRHGDLAKHVRTHVRGKPFKCLICFKSFALQSTLNLHIQSHTRGKRFSCPTCNKRFSTTSHLRLHVEKHLMDYEDFMKNGKEIIDKNGSLEIIHKNVTSLNHINITLNRNIILTENGNIVDMSSDVDEEENSFKCPECNFEFRKKIHLFTHMRSHVLVCYSCEYCPCTFNSKKTLKAHMKQHLIVKQKFVSNGEPSEASVKQRKEIAKAGFPWACPVCGWVYKSSMSCKKHIASRHPKLKLKPLKLVDKAIENTEAQKKNLDFQEDSSHSAATSNGELQTDMSGLNPTVEHNQVYFIANAGDLSLTTVPSQGHHQESQINGFPIYEARNIATNESGTTNSEKQLFENSSLDTCIITIQPAVDVNTPIIGTDISNLLPQNQVIMPQNQVVIPQNQVVLPQNQIIPQDQVVLPQNPVILPKDQVILPQNQAILPQNQVIIPQNQVILPQSQVIIPQDQSFSRCEECNLVFTSLAEYSIHKAAHDQGQPYTYIASGIEDPSKTHYFMGRVINCSSCQMEFHTEEEFQAHCDKYHFSPKAAPEKKKTRPNWRPAARRLTEEEARALSAIEPNSATISEKVLLKSLQEKERFEHPVKEAPKPQEVHRHKCKYCTKSFRKPSDLIRHLRTHTGERPYKCNSCNKRFSIKSTAASHMKTHTKDRSFECYVCSKHFSTTGSLKIHMRLHTGLKPFSCTLCDATFRTSGHKKAHLLKHMKDSMENEEPKIIHLDRNNSNPSDSEEDELLEDNSAIATEGSEYLISLRSSDNGFESPSINGNEEYLSQSEEPKNNHDMAQKHCFNENRGGNVETPKYLLSMKEQPSGEDGFILENDQIIVNITKGDPESPRRSNEKDGYRSESLQKKEPDLDLESFEHELGQDFSCPECTESFSLEEQLRAHKCIKNPSLDLLDHDLFLFPHV